MKTTMMTLAAAAWIALSAISIGCAGTDGTAIPETFNVNSGDVIPTIDDVEARIALEGDQATNLAAAISTWRDGEGTRSHAGRSFLMDAAEILEPAQLSELITMLHERRSELGEARGSMDGRRGGRGDGTCVADGERGPRGERGRDRGRDRDRDRGPHGGMGAALGELADEVEITTETKQALRDAGRSAHEPVRDTMTAYEAGTASAEDVRDAAATARATMEAAAVDILGAESAARLDELLDAHRIEQSQKKLDTLGDRTDDRVEFLTKVLSLTDDQVGLLQAIVEESTADAGAFLTEVVAGEHEAEDVIYHRLTSKAAAEAATRAILDEVQAEIFAQLKEMRPHRGRGFHGPDGPRGPRGPRGDGPGNGGPRGPRGLRG